MPAFIRPALGCGSRPRIKSKFMWCRHQNDALALGARRAIEERATGLKQDHKSALSFLGVDGLPLTGKPGCGRVLWPQQLSRPRPLRTLSKLWWQQYKEDCSGRSAPWLLRNPFPDWMCWQRRPAAKRLTGAERKQLTNVRRRDEAGGGKRLLSSFFHCAGDLAWVPPSAGECFSKPLPLPPQPPMPDARYPLGRSPSERPWLVGVRSLLILHSRPFLILKSSCSTDR